MILNTYKAEKSLNLLALMSDITNKTAYSMKVCKASIYRVICEYRIIHCIKASQNKKPPAKTVDTVDEFDKNAITTKVHAFFFRNELSIIDKGFASVNEDPDMLDIRRTFSELLKEFNFNCLDSGALHIHTSVAIGVMRPIRCSERGYITITAKTVLFRSVQFVRCVRYDVVNAYLNCFLPAAFIGQAK
ncbi:hypothetical protein ANN_20963 [Periplaneta americana]|uniref:Uncharacterized protein n=1 Tax=Periplaneta americana TaxID=6978 RepID=A0ABQ8SE34_PERAM|nr:hypothetical protein ANN_20963 [Periplaneta americana]